MRAFTSDTAGRRATAALAGSALAFTGSYALLGAGAGNASSHREAPLVASDPIVDNTDTYAFVSPDDPETTTLIANWIPFQEPGGGPNFYPWATSEEAQYNIKIDNNGDAEPDITYRWTFETQDARGDVDYTADPPPDPTPPESIDGSFLYNNGAVNSIDDETLLFKQTYTLERIDVEGVAVPIVTDGKVGPSHVGDASMPNYAALRDEAVTETVDGGQSFVGQADDSFFLDLRVFDLLYGGDLSEVGVDTLNCFNVNSVALQVPTAELLGVPAEGGEVDPVIGVWSTTDRASVRTLNGDGTQSYEGDFVQVSRLGQPLVNEVVIPAQTKDAFNALPPVMDADVPGAVNKVLYPEVPKLLEAIYSLPAKEEPRTDLLSIFLTGLVTADGTNINQPAAFGDDDAATGRPSEMLRLNTSIAPADEPSRLGVLGGDNAGFPNGRRLADDVVDIELQALAGAVSVNEDGAVTGVEVVEALAAGDAVDANDKAFGEAFPYLALPTSGSELSGACGDAAPPSGEPGTPGEDGQPGEPGEDGQPGEDGDDGSDGDDGANGTNAGSGSSRGTMPSGGIDTGLASLETPASPLTTGLAAGALALGMLLAAFGALTLKRGRAVARR